MFETSKADWKLFREKLPDWQENYMEGLVQEYIALLSGEGLASEKFRELEKRIRQDKKKPGVCLEMDKSEMAYDLVRLIRDKAITTNDLNEFSDEMKETVSFLLNS